jgi:hypothetical protein
MTSTNTSLCLFALLLLQPFGCSAGFQVHSDVSVPPPISTREYKTYNPIAVAPPPPLDDEEEEEDLFFFQQQQQQQHYQQQYEYEREYEHPNPFEENNFLQDDYAGANRIDYGFGTASSSAANSGASSGRAPATLRSWEPNNDEFISPSRTNTASLVGQGTGGNRPSNTISNNNPTQYVRYQRERPAKKEPCRHFQVDGFIDNTSGANRMEYGSSYGGAHQDSRDNHPSKHYNPSNYMLVHKPKPRTHTRSPTPSQAQLQRRNYGARSVGEANAEPSNPASQFDPSRFEMARPQRPSRSQSPTQMKIQYGISYGGNDVVDPAKEYNPNRYATVPRNTQAPPQAQAQTQQRQSQPTRPLRLTNENRWQREYDRDHNAGSTNPANYFDPSRYSLVRPQNNHNQRALTTKTMQYGNSYGGNNVPDPAKQYNPNRYSYAPATPTRQRPASPTRQDYGGTSSPTHHQDEEERSIANPADLYDPSRYVFAQKDRPHQRQNQNNNAVTIQQDLFTAQQMSDPNAGTDWQPRYARQSYTNSNNRQNSQSSYEAQYSRYSRNNNNRNQQQRQQMPQQMPQQVPLSAGDQFAHQSTNSHGYTAGQYGYGNF